MPTWSGWQRQFLTRANIIITPPNQDFMTQWARHAPGSCKNNPVDLSHTVRGSSRCGDTVAGFGRTQNYGTHAQAASAFKASIETAWVQPLRAALNTGNPFQIDDRAPVVAVLKRWGSVTFADWYATASSSGGGGGGGGGSGSGIHKGWHDIHRSVNSKSPKALSASDRSIKAALRKLHAARKVRL